MTDLFIKTGVVNDKTTQTPNGRDKVSALAGLAGSFQDLIQKAGARIENGFSALTGRSGILGVAKSVEAPRPADNFTRDNSGDARDYADTRTENNDPGDDHAGTQRTERDDSYGRDHGSERHDSGADTGGSDHGESHADSNSGNNDDTHTGGEDTSASDKGGDQQTAATDGDNTGKSESSGQENKTAEGQSETQGGEGESAGNTAQTAQTGAAGEAMSTVLSEMMAGGQALGETGVASEQGKTNSAEGIATATQNIAASFAAQENTSKATAGSDTANGNANQTAHQSQGAAHASAQAKAVANGQSAIVADAGDDAAKSTTANQASALAKTIGDGNKAQVTVTVNNESQNLTSRPNAALVSNAGAGTEGSNQSTSGQQTGAQTQNGSNQNLVGQTHQAQAAAVQAQTAQAAAAQAAQAGGDAKGLVQAQAVTTVSGGSAHAGGGEGVTQPAGVTANQQTQQAQAQAAAQQAKSAEKPVATGRTMVEQISVKVTKALEAGIDKINIQLRPAHMGRVEVKLEMTHDNRLSAMVIADNRETLETLKNDSRELQRALLDAGLNTDSGDLNFSLRGEEQQAQDDKGSSARPLTGDEDIAELEEMIIEEAIIASDGRVITNGRIDVRA